MNATIRYYWFCRGENDAQAGLSPMFLAPENEAAKAYLEGYWGAR